MAETKTEERAPARYICINCGQPCKDEGEALRHAMTDFRCTMFDVEGSDETYEPLDTGVAFITLSRLQLDELVLLINGYQRARMGIPKGQLQRTNGRVEWDGDEISFVISEVH